MSIPGELKRLEEIPYNYEKYTEISEKEAKATLPKVFDFWTLMDEVVEFTKTFHISKYCHKKKYRFTVGGFENLTYTDPSGQKNLKLHCVIKKHLFRGDSIYNLTQIKVTGNNFFFSFDLPFIGLLKES